VNGTDFCDVLSSNKGGEPVQRVAAAIRDAPRKAKPFNQRRQYGTVPSDLWLGERLPGFRKLSSEAKLLALYLLSSPHANMLGLYKLPLAYMAGDIGLTNEAVRAALNELENAHLASYDDETEYMFVRYFIETQVLAEEERLHPKDNRAVHAQRASASRTGRCRDVQPGLQ